MVPGLRWGRIEMGQELVGRGVGGGMWQELWSRFAHVESEMAHQPTGQRCQVGMLDLSGVQRTGPTV